MAAILKAGDQAFVFSVKDTAWINMKNTIFVIKKQKWFSRQRKTLESDRKGKYLCYFHTYLLLYLFFPCFL